MPRNNCTGCPCLESRDDRPFCFYYQGFVNVEDGCGNAFTARPERTQDQDENLVRAGVSESDHVCECCPEGIFCGYHRALYHNGISVRPQDGMRLPMLPQPARLCWWCGEPIPDVR
ncbi:MAG: hypothetical protein ABIE42_05800 [Candidatus Eisenbacteria bacterium]